jgi:hypothetical protein
MAAINRVQYHTPPPLYFCEGPQEYLKIKRRRRPNRRISSFYSFLFGQALEGGEGAVAATAGIKSRTPGRVYKYSEFSAANP